jgi:hypothetical protein
LRKSCRNEKLSKRESKLSYGMKYKAGKRMRLFSCNDDDLSASSCCSKRKDLHIPTDLLGGVEQGEVEVGRKWRVT